MPRGILQVIHTATAVIRVEGGKNYRTRVVLGGFIDLEEERPKKLIFYSSFDNLESALSPAVGPRGYAKSRDLSFVPGKVGNGYYAPYNVDFGIVYSNFVLPSKEGCIEFWAKLVDPPVYLPEGSSNLRTNRRRKI
ncbi:hypothetical protein [Thermospira aquatica]|uniref:Uncharacterized protein n=1 Tax=Thermospira aquatica TaxID=2828656 RepID=A0AAX3BFW2_9SPIR|nr:hypothetical protein [Thermospira aquatica]URA11018.1 hypothetical protein KDW03_04235 [Thermospira aquatica]